MSQVIKEINKKILNGKQETFSIKYICYTCGNKYITEEEAENCKHEE